MDGRREADWHAFPTAPPLAAVRLYALLPADRTTLPCWSTAESRSW
ncbi:hypothetical protein OIE43_19895 [Streptomyces pseudovenezuelae]|nr:hypothetical protein [Streptomyces pseudovenezuelae]